MTNKIARDFDFDDWAGLYIENPQEFEARRQTALMIELARGSEQSATEGRALLDAYEEQVKGCNPRQRMQVASRMMADSAQQLRTELQMLKHTLEQTELLRESG